MIMTAREPYIPRFISGEEAVQGTQYGTAVHKVMELLSFDASYQNVPSDKVYMGKYGARCRHGLQKAGYRKRTLPV